MNMSLEPLGNRQNAFLLHLLAGVPQNDAYIKAGFNSKPDTVPACASRLLNSAKFRKHYNKAIEGIKNKITKPLEVTRDRIMGEYAKLAFLDPRQFYDDSGNLVPIHKIDKDTAAAIAGLEVKTKRIPGDTDGEFDESRTTKIKISDKKAALDSLSRILGMFDDKVKVGIDPESLDKVFDKLPDQFAVAVKAAIAKNSQGLIEDK